MQNSKLLDGVILSILIGFMLTLGFVIIVHFYGKELNARKAISTSYVDTVKVSSVPVDTFVISSKSFPSHTYNEGGVNVKVVQIEGKKFVVASHYYGVSICPFGD